MNLRSFKRDGRDRVLFTVECLLCGKVSLHGTTRGISTRRLELETWRGTPRRWTRGWECACTKRRYVPILLWEIVVGLGPEEDIGRAKAHWSRVRQACW